MTETARTTKHSRLTTIRRRGHTSAWSAANIPSDGKLAGATPLAVSNSSGAIHLFGVTSGGAVDEIDNEGGSWQTGNVLPVGSDQYANNSAIGVDLWASNGFTLFGVNSNGLIKNVFNYGSGPANQTLGGAPALSTSSSISLYSDPSGIEQVFGATSSGDLAVFNFNLGNGGWEQHTLGGSIAPNTLSNASSASVAIAGDLNEQDLFVVGADGLVREDRYVYATNSDSGLAVIDPNTKFDAAAKLTAFTLGSSVNVFAVGQNGKAMWAQYTAAGGWTGFVTLDSLTGNLGVTFPADTALEGVVQGGSLDLYAVGTDGHVKRYVYAGGGWTFASLDGLPSFPAGAPLAVCGDGSTIDVFGVLADGSVEHLHGVPALDNLTYSYDALGRVSTFSSVDGTAAYGYDQTSQLVSATYTTATGGHQPANESHTWDANGNNAATGNVVSSNNELTNDGTFTYTFDADGNRTSRQRISSDPANDYHVTYTWDYRNRLTDVEFFNNSNVLTKHVHYTYDVYDNLIESQIDRTGGGTYTTTNNFVLDVSPQPPAQALSLSGTIDPSAPADTVLEFANGALAYRFLNAPSPSGADVVAAEEAVNSLTSAGAVHWMLVNNQGSLTDVVDATGALIDHIVDTSFGATAFESNPSVHHLQGYAGGISDPNTGLIKFGERWYDPVAAVWISADRARFAAGDTNLSRPVFNDPTDLSDPSGLMSKGGKRNLRISGIKGPVTAAQLQKLLDEAIANGASKAHIQELEAWIKVAKRSGRRGCTNLRVVIGKAGTILAVAEVVSIVNHGTDRIELRKISEQTNDDGSVTSIYFGRQLEKTGFLGLGPENQTGSVLYVITVPKSRVDLDGLPPDSLCPRLYNRDDDTDVLQQMGITEEYIQLPDNIKSTDDLLNGPKNSAVIRDE